MMAAACAWLLLAKVARGETIPSFRANSTDSIQLAGGDYTGTVATELGLLTGVTMFSVLDNKLTGTLPSQLGLLSQCNFFSVGVNHFTGPCPSQIGALSLLTNNLEIHHNDLTSSLPTQLGQLTGMARQLWANDNFFKNGPPSQFGRLTGLTGGLFLERNTLTASLPSQIGRLSNLETAFVLMQNKLGGTIPSEYGGLAKLTAPFNLQSNSLTGSLPTQLGRLTGLAVRFNVQLNALTSTLPSQLGLLQDFEEVMTFAYNSFEGQLPSQLFSLSMLTRQILFNNNGFSGSVPTEIGFLSNVRSEVHLDLNSFSGAVPSEVGHLTSLTSELVFYANQLTSLPTEVGCLTGLKSMLAFSENSIDQAIPTQLGSLVALSMDFDLSNNAFTGDCPSELGRMSLMEQQLDLSSNAMFGTISTELGLLVEMTSSFLLYSNLLCEDVPTEVQALSSQVTGWQVTTGNDLGSVCCAEAHCGPSSAPTVSPTVACDKGTYYEPDDNACTVCPAGKSRNDTNTPAVCTTCEVGRYRAYSSDSSNAHSCYECPTGRVSSSDRTSCDTCNAGEYTKNDTECVSCERGRFAPTALADACYKCSAGFATGVDSGATSCSGCDGGTYSAALSVNCSTCPAGKFSSSSSSECTDCSSGYFSSVGGATSCSKCSSEFGSAYTSPEGATSCEACVAGYYWNNLDSVCETCPDKGVDCDESGSTLAELEVEEGYYRFTATSTDVYTCTYTRNCKGGNATTHHAQCHEGCKGPLCAVCASGWYLNSYARRCVRCENSTSTLSFVATLVVVALVVLGAAVGVWQRARLSELVDEICRKYKKQLFESCELATMILITMQTIVLVRSSHSQLDGEELQPPYGGFVAAMSFLSLDVVHGVPIGCMQGFDHGAYMLMWLVLPVVVFLVGTVLLRRAERPMRNRWLGWYMQGLLLILPTISNTICESFRCTHYDDGEYAFLASDHQIDCHSNKYTGVVVLAGLGVLMYPIGVPLGIYIWLRRLRFYFDPPALGEKAAIENRKLEPEVQACAIRVFALRYKPRYWYFEVCNIARRLLLTSAALVFNNVGTMLLFILAVAIITTVFTREAQPELALFLSAFNYVCHWLIVLVIIALMAVDAGMTSGAGSLIIGLSLLALNLSIFAMVFFNRQGNIKRRRTRISLQNLQMTLPRERPSLNLDFGNPQNSQRFSYRERSSTEESARFSRKSSLSRTSSNRFTQETDLTVNPLQGTEGESVQAELELTGAPVHETRHASSLETEMAHDTAQLSAVPSVRLEARSTVRFAPADV